MLFPSSCLKPIFNCILGLTLFSWTAFFLEADPWGKDVDLVHRPLPICTTSNEPSSRLANWGIQAIRFHQTVISPADGPRSHYIPSSSQYTLEAMKKCGFFKGFILGCDRLMRENDEEWVYRKTYDAGGHLMKWDPIEGKT